MDVWPAEHMRVHERLTSGEKWRPIVDRHQVHLTIGDVLIFRGDAVHAGSAYPTKPNMRLHCYIDSPLLRRPKNKTYILEK